MRRLLLALALIGACFPAHAQKTISDYSPAPTISLGDKLLLQQGGRTTAYTYGTPQQLLNLFLTQPNIWTGAQSFNQGNGSELIITTPIGGPVLGAAGTTAVQPVSLVGHGAASGVQVSDDTDTDMFAILPGTGGVGPVLNCTGPETTVNCSIQVKGAAGGLQFYSTASSDYMEFADSSSPGSGPDIICGGPESSVSCNIQPKGFGNVYFYAFGGASAATLAIEPYQQSGAYPGPAVASQVAASPLLLYGGSGNGQVVAMSPFAETASVRNTSGSSYTVAAGIGIVILDGVSSTYTLTMPAAPLNGQVVELECGSSVTTLTVSANTGQTMKGTASSCSSTQGHKWRYFGAVTSWYMLF